jgi:DNA-binding transcriptional MocR family regulator
MPDRIIPEDVGTNSALTHGAKHLYGFLLACANSGGKCYSSRTELARALGSTRNAVKRYADELTAAGLISQLPGRSVNFRNSLGTETVTKITTAGYLVFSRRKKNQSPEATTPKRTRATAT